MLCLGSVKVGDGGRHHSTFAHDSRYKLIQWIPKTSPSSRRAARNRDFAAGFYHVALIEGEGRSQGLDLAWLRALIRIESGFDPMAVSPRGAMGLMQIMPATAKRYGVDDAFRCGTSAVAGDI